MDNLRLFRRSKLAVDAATGLECLLRPNRTLRLAGARGHRIRCTAGCAWITAPGMVEDLFLRDGEDWRIDTDGLVLVEAIGSAVVAIGRAADRASMPRDSEWKSLISKVAMPP